MSIKKEDAYKEQYGNGARKKSKADKAATPTVKQPKGSLQDSDIIELLSTDVYIEEQNFGGKLFYVESLLIQVKRGEREISGKLFVSWLSSTGYPVLAYATTSADCKTAFEANESGTFVPEKKNNHIGNAVSAYQNAASQTEGVAALKGKKIRVKVVGYYMDRFNTESPRVVYDFSFV